MKKIHTGLDRVFRYAEMLRFGKLHLCFDHATGLRAIIAIHSLALGPAIGGCRYVSYPSAEAAIEDAIRLASMMSIKAAASGLRHGGAKAVLMSSHGMKKNRRACLEAFGDFVHELNGQYITAVDSGTFQSDMDIIHERTPWVTCTTQEGVPNDPSPLTALGVRRGIEAAVGFVRARDTLEDIHVAIQGAGHVGYLLAESLFQAGARITICDINPVLTARCVSEFGAVAVPPDQIYDVEADVFAPCALGAILNHDTIERLRVSIVAGSANNQLAHAGHAKRMHERNILYAPDFVINAGGLIYSAAVYDHADITRATCQVSDIYNTLTAIFQKAQAEDTDTHCIALRIAQARLAGGVNISSLR